MVEIVELTSETSQLLNNIAPDVFDEDVRSDYLEAFLTCPRHKMLLAVTDGRVVGMASSVEYFHPDKPPQMWINEVGTASTHRRQGIGRRLTQALVEDAQARGCVYAWLGTDEDNSVAQACFDTVPEGEPKQAFFLYEWDLED